MRKKFMVRAAAFCLSAAMLATGSMASLAAAPDAGTDVQAAAPLAASGIPSPFVITEMVPNTVNIDDSDGYEYFELVNLTGQELDLSAYDLVYDNGNTQTVWTPTIQTLPANGSMLVWIKNEANIAAGTDKQAFLDHYGLEADALVAEVESGGMSNSGSRSMSIVTKTGKTLLTVSYNAADSSDSSLGEGEAISYSYDGDQVTAVYDGTPTPYTYDGLITGAYEAPAAVGSPSVTVSSETSMDLGEDLTVSVNGTSLTADIVRAQISVDGGSSYEMTYDGDVLTGTIPYEDVAELASFTYTVTLFDGTNTAVSEAQTVTVTPDSGEVDTTKAPALVITEILPDSSNIGGSDGYEFIEISNNSDQAIDLKDYKLYYHYTDTGSDSLWWETDGKVLDPGEALVFWIKNGPNDSYDIDSFNSFYGTSLTEDNLIQLSNGGMANSGGRGVKLCTGTGDIVDMVVYNQNGADNTNKDKSITFQNQYSAGSFSTVMTADSAEPTPGTVTETEKAQYQAHIVVPQAQPELTDHTPDSFSNDTESLTFSLTAVSAETTIKTVKLYAKYDGEETYTLYNLLRGDGDVYEKTLENIDLRNKAGYSYYFEVSDGFTTVSTEIKEVKNTDPVGAADFNLEDGQVVSGETQLIVAGDTMIVDGMDISSMAEKSIGGAGQIVFETSQTDVFFKNAVAVEDDVVGIFNEGTYDQWETYTYDINASHFDYDTKTVTVEFHAGNKANALEHDIENNDDFVLRNIRMVLPNGRTLYAESYQAKMGLGAVEHDGLDGEPMVDVDVTSQEQQLNMGDGTSKYEILYVTFRLEETDFDAVRFQYDTALLEDGTHTVSNGTDTISVIVDNTAPEITSNIEDGEEYHSGTIEASAQDAISGEVEVKASLDGEDIALPYSFSSVELSAGSHTLVLTAQDGAGNTEEQTIVFTTPQEEADITGSSPEDGAQQTEDPTLSVTAEDPSGDEMTVTFKRGDRYVLGDEEITQDSGVSSTSGSDGKDFETGSGNGFPYDSFEIAVGEEVSEEAVVGVKWQGTSNNEKTFLYVYNVASGEWEQVEAEQTVSGDTMTLEGEVSVKDHRDGGVIRVMVQNGEGYTPAQYAEGAGDASLANQEETPRDQYDFTLAWESDTQYYNEDYDGNPDQDVDGSYQYQLDIHNWVLANRDRMNIQYMFHTGDIIDDEPNTQEWEQADAAYALLDEAGFPYGVLAGNHDVGHLSGDYSNYSIYFGEDRFSSNPWYGGSYEDNRGHYDLISVGGIDFIMIYMGWGIGDEEIAWLNDVLAQYPERKAILNFHEYLLASGGLGEEPQRIHDEVVAVNENVCMVFSGHYHNAYTRTEEFTNADGSTRTVYSMLFDYQGLPEGGMGYMRLLHFDLEGERMIVRTYSPSLDDYSAKDTVSGADSSLNGEETFEISFESLGIEPSVKTLSTSGLEVDVYGTEVIGTAEHVKSGETASVIWTNAPEGSLGWYAEVTDANGGLSRTPVQYVNVEKAEEPSTEEPSTEDPSTEDPSTEDPSTEEPSTEEPSTEAPSSEKPSTEAPSGTGGNGNGTAGGQTPAGGGKTPETGDIAPVAGFWALCGASLLAAVTVMKKKKETEE